MAILPFAEERSTDVYLNKLTPTLEELCIIFEDCQERVDNPARVGECRLIKYALVNLSYPNGLSLHVI